MWKVYIYIYITSYYEQMKSLHFLLNGLNKIQFLYYNVHPLLVYNSMCLSTLRNQIFEHFVPYPRNLTPISRFSPIFPPTLLQPKADTNSISIHCLFWIFHRNWVIKYIVFCNWLLKLSVRFLRYIHVGSCTNTLFLFLWQRTLHCITFSLSIHWLMNS